MLKKIPSTANVMRICRKCLIIIAPQPHARAGKAAGMSTGAKRRQGEAKSRRTESSNNSDINVPSRIYLCSVDVERPVTII